MSVVHIRITKKIHEAEKELSEAIRLNPNRTAYYLLLAAIKLDFRQYDKALDICQKGLSIDPQNKECLSLQARILTKLGHKKEAQESIQQSLQNNPENVYTLTQSGWIHLETGNNEQALEDFKEALRLQPGYEYAHKGLLQALRTKYFIFRIYLKYINWLNRLHLTKATVEQPYSLFTPFLNIFLRFDKFGKYALKRNEFIYSVIIAVLLTLIFISTLLIISFWIMAPDSNIVSNISYLGLVILVFWGMIIIVRVIYRRMARRINK